MSTEDKLFERMDAILERWYLSAICKSGDLTEEQIKMVFAKHKEEGLEPAEKLADTLLKQARGE